MLVQRPNPRSSGPQRYGGEQLGPAGAGAPPDPLLILRLQALSKGGHGPGRHGIFERPPRPLRYQPRGSTQPPPSRALNTFSAMPIVLIVCSETEKKSGEMMSVAGGGGAGPGGPGGDG